MAFGVTEYGFKKKTRQDLVASMEVTARSLFGDDVNLTDKSPLGMLINLFSFPLAEDWQTGEDVYNSAYIDTSVGASLRGVGKFIGITQKNASFSTVLQTFSGTEGTVIPLGFKVETATEKPISFETTESGVIDASGSITLKVQCVQPGEIGQVPANTITVITTPISGLDSTTNSTATDGGYDRETDFAFRERYKDSVAIGGSSTTDSIRASLLDLLNVRSTLVRENQTAVIDGNGLPPKSVEAIVLGGDDKTIAQTILDTKAGGIEAYGSIVIGVKDKAGNTHQIGFSRPTIKDIYVTVNVIKNAAYPLNGDTLIQDQVIAYIGGINSVGDDFQGLNVGEDVIFLKVTSAIDQIPGIDDMTVKVGLTSNPTQSANIVISNTEIAETDADKVQVIS